jgi:hypothetical protein
MGSNTFCFKACDPANPNAANFCQHIYDRIGCAYNAPNAAQNGTFESCLGDTQDFPGVYTDSAGATHTYTQPPESLGAIPPLTWTARVPKSSSCTQFQSAQVFSALAGVQASETGLAGAPTGTGTVKGTTGTGTAKGSGTGTGTQAPGASKTSGGDAQVVAVSGLVGLVGVVFSVLAFA